MFGADSFNHQYLISNDVPIKREKNTANIIKKNRTKNENIIQQSLESPDRSISQKLVAHVLATCPKMYLSFIGKMSP